MHTDKNDIWEDMSEPELRKLEEKVSQAGEAYLWERRIEGIKEPTDVEDVRFGLMEAGRFRFSEEQSQKLWAALEAKEKSILAQQPEKKEVKPKKTSVKSKLKEGKEKVAKTPAKKTKEKEAQACV